MVVIGCQPVPWAPSVGVTAPRVEAPMDTETPSQAAGATIRPGADWREADAGYDDEYEDQRGYR